MEKYNKYHESLNIDCCDKDINKPKPKNNCCCDGINLPSHDNEIEVLIRQLKREVKELLKTTQAKLLCQDKKIAETMVYIKNNLSNAIRDLLDSMLTSGELDEIIESIITLDVIMTYDTVADMKNASLISGQYVQTLGYYSINDGGAATYYIRELGLNETSDNGLLISLDSGLVAELIISDEVNVKQFGAYGDNIHDDTESIQKLFDLFDKTNNWIHIEKPELNIEQDFTGFKIVFPCGKYKISNVNVKGYNLDITGNGIINGTLTLGDDTIKWYNTKVSNITFVGPTSGIILKNFRNGIIDNVRFNDCTNAIYLPLQNHDYQQATRRIKVINCHTKNITNFIYSDDTTGTNTFADFIITNNDISLTGYVMYIHQMDGVLFNNNTIFGGNKDIFIEHGVEMTFISNQFFESLDTCLNIKQFQNLIISNNNFAYNSKDNLHSCILLENGDTSNDIYSSFNISNNNFLQTTSNAIKVIDTNTGNISGNTFTAVGNNPLASVISTNNDKYGIICTNSNYVLANNNISVGSLQTSPTLTINSGDYESNNFIVPLYVDKINVSGTSPFTITQFNGVYCNKIIQIEVYGEIYITDSYSQKTLSAGIYDLHINNGYVTILN